MSRFEKKVLDYVHSNIDKIYLIIVVLISLVIRFDVRADNSNYDINTFLINWYDELKARGGLKGLGTPIPNCNYNFLYMTIIALMTYLPWGAMTSYKLLSMIFDYLLGIVVARFVYELTDHNKKVNAYLAFTIVIMSPLVISNSAVWGQCDSIYVFFVIISLLCLYKSRFILSFVLLGLAFSFKLQAVFILPFYLFYYFYKQRYSIFHFLIIPLIMEISAIPSILAGRDILDTFRVYIGQTGNWPVTASNYPTFWYIFFRDEKYSSYETMNSLMVLTTVFVILMYIYLWVHKKIEIDAHKFIMIAYLLSFTCVMFLPSMHDRYAYMVEMLGIILVFMDYKMFPVIVILNCITMATYGNFLFYSTANIRDLSWLNFGVYLIGAVYINLMLSKEDLRRGYEKRI
ncbi:MAG: glycosyltransferase 87 family protein [Butyrivibrio sp.]|uniref:glycosyltransferase 87 family protein n=1 Tax=Butyrivibrio sp. TaxID=28121 RepID=UPI0025D6E24F|nr:glycosyltransferase 87 family protein [Butyrivibrio sp.]MCR5770902.1 glycosyltransferase 87 family protein [Butyrivibrio sp.]